MIALFPVNPGRETASCGWDTILAYRKLPKRNGIMNEASVLQALYRTIVRLLTGQKPSTPSDAEETPHVDSVAERLYFISHIDDYGDCV